MIYVTDSFIYKSTLTSRYKMPAAWFNELGESDFWADNPHRSSSRSYLYYRPRVEQFLLERRDAYQQRLGMRIRRMKERRIDQIGEAIEQAEATPIYAQPPLPNYRTLVKHMRGARLKIRNRFLVPRQPDDFYDDWLPAPDEIFTRVLYACTDYTYKLDCVFKDDTTGGVGAPEAFLILRDRATETAIRCAELIVADTLDPPALLEAGVVEKLYE